MADGGNQRVMFPVTLLESVSGDQQTPEQLRRRLETTDLNRPEETKNHVFHNSEKEKSEPELMNSS